MKVDVTGFWRDGFTLVRNVYTEDEIEAMREDAFAMEGKHKGDLLSHPLLGRVVVDGKMAEIARILLKRDDLVYFGDTAVAIREGTPGWHKDNADRRDPKAPDWRSPYTQLRFGIYTQDHAKHSGGLNVRQGSHNVPDFTTGKVVHLPSRVGDIGVWSMRITHSAAGTLLKWAPGRNRAPDPSEVKNIDPKIILPRHKKRVVLFSALGADDEHHDRYVRYLKTREYMVNQWRETHYTDEQIGAMEAQGVKLRNVPKEIEGDPNVGKSVGYRAIPY